MIEVRKRPEPDGLRRLGAEQDEAGGVVVRHVGDVAGDHLARRTAPPRAACRSRPRAGDLAAAHDARPRRRSSWPPRSRRRGACARRKAWHWAVACGWDSTRVDGAQLERARGAIRWWRTGRITSPRIHTSPSAASWSRVWLTEPSIVFSIGTSACGTSPSRTARKQSIDGRVGDLVELGVGPSSSQQRLLAEGPRRPEVADPHARRARAGALGNSPVGGRLGRRAAAAGLRRAPSARAVGGAARAGPPVASATAGSSSGDRRCPGAPSTSSLRYTRAWSRACSEVTTAPGLVAVDQRDRPRLAAAHVAVGVVAHHALEAQRRSAGCARSPRPGAPPGSGGRARPCSRRAIGPLQAGLAVDQPRRGPVGQQHLLGAAQAAQRDPERDGRRPSAMTRRPRRRPRRPRASTSIRS